MPRIIIADDHSIMRKGVKQILIAAFPSAHVEEVSNAEDLLKKVILEQWDLVITDINMPGRSGLEVLQDLRKSFSRLPMLVMSMYPEDQYALRVMKAGASGYLTKGAEPEELLKAVNRVLQGRKYISSGVAEKLADSIDENSGKNLHEHLSDREFEIMKLVAGGKSVADIATQFTLSSSTVSTYRSRVLAKLNLKTNSDLTMYAIAFQLI